MNHLLLYFLFSEKHENYYVPKTDLPQGIFSYYVVQTLSLEMKKLRFNL